MVQTIVIPLLTVFLWKKFKKIASQTQLNIGDVIVQQGYNVATEYVITKKVNDNTYCAIAKDGTTMFMKNVNTVLKTMCIDGAVKTYYKSKTGVNIKEFLEI